MRAKPPRELETTIDSLGSDGFGAAQVGERVVRIKNALAGELVQARVLKRRKGEWLAEAFHVAENAAIRTKAACEYFPRCGGCAMQHLHYDAQVTLKQQHLLEALAHHAVVPLKVNAPTLGPRFYYRTKARVGVRVVSGQVLVGFRESFSNRVGRGDSCLTLTSELSSLIAPLKTLIGSLSCPDRIPQVELAAGDRARALILRHLEPLTAQDLDLIETFAVVNEVRCFGQSGGYDTVNPISRSAAEPFLSYANVDFGLHFLFRPMDFTQVNLDMNRRLVRAAVSSLAAPAGARVLDLFCGIGNFSLALAASGLSVVGLEAAADSIDRARTNAVHNRLEELCEFAVQDLYDADCLDLGKADYLLLDPPRSGAGPNLSGWIESSGAKRLVYVSCSPESFASDAAVLVQTGFELEQVGIFDMFPHTAHVETLGVFQKRW